MQDAARRAEPRPILHTAVTPKKFAPTPAKQLGKGAGKGATHLKVSRRARGVHIADASLWVPWPCRMPVGDPREEVRASFASLAGEEKSISTERLHTVMGNLGMPVSKLMVCFPPKTRQSWLDAHLPSPATLGGGVH